MTSLPNYADKYANKYAEKYANKPTNEPNTSHEYSGRRHNEYRCY